MKYTLENFCTSADSFFSKNGEFPTTLKYLKILFHAAFSSQTPLAKMDIAAIRSLQRDLAQFLEIAALALDTGVLEKTPSVSSVFEKDGLPLQALYCGPLIDNVLTPWSYFPRHITKNDFLSPVATIQTFFQHNSLLDWKIILEDLFSAALLRQSAFEFSDMIDNAIEIQDDLFKVMEGIHLIKLRSL